MNRYVVLLRGVNVGGVKLPMAEFSAALAAGGFATVRTVLATGNAVCDASGSVEQVAERVESIVQHHFGLPVPALVYSGAEFGDIANWPFPLQPPGEEFHRYLSFSRDPQAARHLAGQLPATVGEYLVHGPVLYWWAAKGTSTTCPLATALQRLARQHLLTTRNLNTVQKIAKLL
ncbi:DUF1697 domain-containing protein [Glutamicibacter uratoxydans]|uniref:DUF1697 domain-containing protein n=1 Tax=Glutamicibacter uratoxydans TaxID=43667 RepID=UPI003D6FAD00